MRKYRFCPSCGFRISSSGTVGEKQACTSCHEIFYHNSQPCVGALAIKAGKVLLIKRVASPFRGYWDIPGGFLKPGEHPEDGLVREFEEETGLLIKPMEILGIFMDKYGPGGDETLNIHYVAKIVSGRARAGSDAVKLKWFDMRKLPQKIAFKNGREALELWLSKG